MKALLLKTLIFGVLASLIMTFIFDPIFRDSNANSKTFREFNNLPKDSLDILIIGSSHSKNAFFPRVIDSALRTKTFNMSTGGQNYISANLLLEDVLKKVKPKLVIVDFFTGLMRLPKTDEAKGSQLKVIDYTSLSKRKISTIHKIYNFKEFPSVFSETIRNHNKWYDRNWTSEEFSTKNSNFIFYKGYFNSPKIISNNERQKYENFIIEHENYLKITPSKKELKDFEKNYSEILETIKICKENNTQILFVSAPYFDSFFSDRHNKLQYLLHNYFKNHKDLNYIDFNLKFNELGLNFEDYWDKGHLNINGSYKTSISLAKGLSDLGYFTINDSVYFKKEFIKIKPRNNDNIQEQINLSLSNRAQEIQKNGVLYKIKHRFNNSISIKNSYFDINKDNRFILIETNQPLESSSLNNKYFLISSTINPKDFNKRPKWQLGTNKNKLHWEVSPKSFSIEDKNYVLLSFDKKCEITNFEEMRIILKDKESKKNIGKALVIKNVTIKK